MQLVAGTRVGIRPQGLRETLLDSVFESQGSSLLPTGSRSPILGALLNVSLRHRQGLAVVSAPYPGHEKESAVKDVAFLGFKPSFRGPVLQYLLIRTPIFCRFGKKLSFSLLPPPPNQPNQYPNSLQPSCSVPRKRLDICDGDSTWLFGGSRVVVQAWLSGFATLEL